MGLRIKGTNITLKIIGWLEIIGGLVGLGVMAHIMYQTGTINGIILLLLFSGIGLFGFSIYSGKKLITKIDSSSGIIYSIINQFFQLLQWAILGYKFTFSAGAALLVGIEKTSLLFNASLASDYETAINSGNDFYLKINLVALLIIIVLFDILRERRKLKKPETIEPTTDLTLEENTPFSAMCPEIAMSSVRNIAH